MSEECVRCKPPNRSWSNKEDDAAIDKFVRLLWTVVFTLLTNYSKLKNQINQCSTRYYSYMRHYIFKIDYGL